MTSEPKTSAQIKKNKENLELADQILAIRKAAIYQGTYNIENDNKGKPELLDFYEFNHLNFKNGYIRK